MKSKNLSFVWIVLTLNFFCAVGLADNPVITHKYTADPAALVYDGTVYLYTGHDEAPKNHHTYRMKEWLCFSSTDMVNWTEHPVPLSVKDFSWAKKDAPAGDYRHC